MRTIFLVVLVPVFLAVFSAFSEASSPENDSNASEYTYLLLGARTQEEFEGVIGSISVQDIAIPVGTPQHFVASFTISDGPITRGANGIEIGWMQCNYAHLGIPCEKPILFAANSVDGFRVDQITFFPQFKLELGQDYLLAIVGWDGVFAAWIWLDNQWHYLVHLSLPFEKAQVRQSWELVSPSFDGISPVHFGRSQWTYLLENREWRLWDDTVLSDILNNGKVYQYQINLLNNYYRWFVEEISP